MTIHVGTDGGEPFADDMRFDTDLDLILELADQAAQGALITYGVDDWQQSPLTRMLDVAARKVRGSGRGLPASVIEAQERFTAARWEVAWLRRLPTGDPWRRANDRKCFP